MEIVIFSGAGISAESGIATFRDSGGLWEQYKIEEVATPEAIQRNPKLVLDFYNHRRKNIKNALPNNAHKQIPLLDSIGHVTVITQNIDDLHERAGSKNVLHLHGCITQAKGCNGDKFIEEIGFKDIEVGDTAKDGSQLRPHIVWFGEAVPAMDDAIEIVKKADIMITVGSSLNVYPAASLVFETPRKCQHFVIDPNVQELNLPENFTLIQENASMGMKNLVQHLTSGNKKPR
ncbi:MAG: NAD-dependent deacylase [Bacteroidetes bacterium]|nr:NAD-dependent deacylase [Bacteroidota bacterium]